MSTWEVHKTDPKHAPCWYCALSVKMSAPTEQAFFTHGRRRAINRETIKLWKKQERPGPRPPEKEVYFMGFKVRKKVARGFLYDIIKMQQFTINRILEEQATQKPEALPTLVQPVTDPRIIERIAKVAEGLVPHGPS